MKLFDSELQYLSELYQRLKKEFASLEHTPGQDDAATLADSIIRNRELLSRIGQMNSRVSQLAEEWESFRRHMDPLSKKQTQHVAKTVHEQADELTRIAADLVRQLEERRRNLEEELTELQKGFRYLESVKPIKANYPKFVDSLG